MDVFWVSDCAKELGSGFSESWSFTFGIMAGRVRVQSFVALGSRVVGAFRITDLFPSVAPTMSASAFQVQFYLCRVLIARSQCHYGQGPAYLPKAYLCNPSAAFLGRPCACVGWVFR